MDIDQRIEQWEHAVISNGKEVDTAAHELFNQALRDWNPDRWRALRTIKFLINNYTDSDCLGPPKEGFRGELQELIVELAKSDQLQIVQMLRELNGRAPAKFAKHMLDQLNVPEYVYQGQVYHHGQIKPPTNNKDKEF